ncbi:MAG: CHASE domain-containing protein [Burkholderiaceae bacterium]
MLQDSRADAPRPGDARRSASKGKPLDWWLKSIASAPVGLAVVACSVGLTIAAWAISANYEERRISDRFEFRVELARRAILERMNGYEKVLRQGASLLTFEPDLTRAQWRHYVTDLRMATDFPGTQGYGVSVRIPAEGLSDHIESVRREGFPQYSVRPPDPRGFYHSIVYLEPFDWRNQRAFGYDMYSHPVRRAAMDQAIDTGEPTLSASVQLVQETSVDVQPGLLFYMPVYDALPPDADVETRRSRFRAMAYMVLRTGDLMHGVLGVGTDALAIEIIDPASTFHDGRLYSSEVAPKDDTSLAARLFARRELHVGSRTWQLLARPGSAFFEAGERSLSTVVGTVGVLIDLLLMAVIHLFGMLFRRREEERRSSMQVIIDHTGDGLMLVDHDGLIRFANPAAEAIFGRGRRELAGIPLGHLIPGAQRERHRELIRHAFGDERSREFMANRTVYGLHKDGFEVPLQIRLATIVIDGETLVLADVRDLTEQHAREQAVAEKNHELERSNAELESFAHGAAHDLKAPLRAIDNLANWIIEDAGSQLPEASQRHLQLMQQRINRMNRLLEDMLRYAQYSRGDHDLEVTSISEILGECEALAARQERFTIDMVSADIRIRTERTPLKQILLNLIANSIKHHDRDHGAITVACQWCEGQLELVLSDDGPGIPPEFRERIFGMFQTLKPRDELESSGVGLALVRRLVENNGGSIGFDERPGRGATVRLTWLCELAPASRAASSASAKALG